MARDHPRLLPSIESLPAWTMSPLPWLLPSIESLPKWLPPLTELSREAHVVYRTGESRIVRLRPGDTFQVLLVTQGKQRITDPGSGGPGGRTLGPRTTLQGTSPRCCRRRGGPQHRQPLHPHPPRRFPILPPSSRRCTAPLASPAACSAPSPLSTSPSWLAPSSSPLSSLPTSRGPSPGPCASAPTTRPRASPRPTPRSQA